MLNAAADRDQHLLGVVLDQPRRVRGVPVIRLFDLPAVVDRLFEEPILVFDAVPEAAMSNVAIESMKQAAKRPNPPLPRAASGSSSIMRSEIESQFGNRALHIRQQADIDQVIAQ